MAEDVLAFEIWKVRMLEQGGFTMHVKRDFQI